MLVGAECGGLPMLVGAECGGDRWATFVKNENGELPALCAQRNCTAAAVRIQATAQTTN